MSQIDHRHTRRDYRRGALDRSDMAGSPFEQLKLWLEDAQDQPDATAMVLSTADAQARPTARLVLLKHVDKRGLCWYSNADSLKGRQLAENPQASLLFFWAPLERQIRIQGQVEQLSAAEADAYFETRPLGSRLAAVASQQSQPIENRQALEARLAEAEARYPDGRVPRPQSWIGFRLVPEYFEFWQGRENRLHDRLVYAPVDSGWEITRLMP